MRFRFPDLPALGQPTRFFRQPQFFAELRLVLARGTLNYRSTPTNDLMFRNFLREVVVLRSWQREEDLWFFCDWRPQFPTNHIAQRELRKLQSLLRVFSKRFGCSQISLHTFIFEHEKSFLNAKNLSQTVPGTVRLGFRLSARFQIHSTSVRQLHIPQIREILWLRPKTREQLYSGRTVSGAGRLGYPIK